MGPQIQRKILVAIWGAWSLFATRAAEPVPASSIKISPPELFTARLQEEDEALRAMDFEALEFDLKGAIDPTTFEHALTLLFQSLKKVPGSSSPPAFSYLPEALSGIPDEWWTDPLLRVVHASMTGTAEQKLRVFEAMSIAGQGYDLPFKFLETILKSGKDLRAELGNDAEKIRAAAATYRLANALGNISATSQAISDLLQFAISSTQTNRVAAIGSLAPAIANQRLSAKEKQRLKAVLREALASGDQSVRLAGLSLARFSPASLGPEDNILGLVLPSLNIDLDPKTALDAAETAVSLTPNPDVQETATTLIHHFSRATNSATRLAAVETVGRFAASRHQFLPEEDLRQFLDDPDEKVRSQAALIWIRLRPGIDSLNPKRLLEIAPRVPAFLHSSDPLVQSNALLAAEALLSGSETLRLQSELTTNLAKFFLSLTNSNLRNISMEQLWILGSRRAESIVGSQIVEWLQDQTPHPDPLVRRLAFQSLLNQAKSVVTVGSENFTIKSYQKARAALTDPYPQIQELGFELMERLANQSEATVAAMEARAQIVEIVEHGDAELLFRYLRVARLTPGLRGFPNQGTPFNRTLLNPLKQRWSDQYPRLNAALAGAIANLADRQRHSESDEEIYNTLFEKSSATNSVVQVALISAVQRLTMAPAKDPRLKKLLERALASKSRGTVRAAINQLQQMLMREDQPDRYALERFAEAVSNGLVEPSETLNLYGPIRSRETAPRQQLLQYALQWVKSTDRRTKINGLKLARSLVGTLRGDKIWMELSSLAVESLTDAWPPLRQETARVLPFLAGASQSPEVLKRVGEAMGAELQRVPGSEFTAILNALTGRNAPRRYDLGANPSSRPVVLAALQAIALSPSHPNHLAAAVRLVSLADNDSEPGTAAWKVLEAEISRGLRPDEQSILLELASGANTIKPRQTLGETCLRLLESPSQSAKLNALAILQQDLARMRDQPLQSRAIRKVLADFDSAGPRLQRAILQFLSGISWMSVPDPSLDAAFELALRQAWTGTSDVKPEAIAFLQRSPQAIHDPRNQAALLRTLPKLLQDTNSENRLQSLALALTVSGTLSARIRETENLEASLRSAVEDQTPGVSTSARLALARFYVRTGKTNQATTIANDLYSSRGSNPMLSFTEMQLGEVLMDVGELRAAIEVFEEWRRRSGYTYSMHNERLRKLYEMTGQPEKAARLSPARFNQSRNPSAQFYNKANSETNLQSLLTAADELLEKPGGTEDAMSVVDPLVGRFVREQKAPQIVAHYESKLANATNKLTAQKVLAAVYERTGRTEQALATYKKLLEMGDPLTSIRRRLIYLYESNGEISKALDLMREELADHPGDTHLYPQMATLLRKAGQTNEVKKLAGDFEEMLQDQKVGRPGGQENIILGDIYAESGFVDEAIRAYQAGLESNDYSRRQAKMKLVALLDKSGKSNEALTLLLKEEDADLLSSELSRSAIKGDFSSITNLAWHLLEMPSTLPYHRQNALQSLENIYDRKGRRFELLQILERRSEEQPANALYLQAVARLYERQDEPQNARKFFEKAFSLHPNDPQILQQLLGIYQRTGAGEQQESILRKAIDLMPDNIFYRSQLIRILATTNRKQEARQLARELEAQVGRALDFKNPNSVMTLQQVADAFIALEDHDKAISYLEKATSVPSPFRNPVIYDLLAHEYEAAGKTNEARKVREQMPPAWPGTSRARPFPGRPPFSRPVP